MRRGENIYKRRDGRWEGRYIASRDENGKARYRSVYAVSYVEVRDKLRECSQELKIGTSTLFEKIGESWLSGVKLRCKLSTYNKYFSTYRNHLLPEFRGLPISELSNKRIEDFISRKSELSDKTRADILSTLKQVVKFAEHVGFNIDNTLFDMSVRRSANEIRVLTVKEQKCLESFLLSCDSLLAVGIYLTLYTGLRIGELCALKRSDINFDTGIIHISGTMQRLRVDNHKSHTQVLITEPKSKCSIRDIPIPRVILNICQEYYCNIPDDSYILTGNADYIEPRLLSYHFSKFTKACDLENIHFHTLRHYVE
ncbi:MAG: site-specific integrase [Ruminococcus sp.]|nr:site-specific integrase [Ruminococcus sp.]